MDNTQAPPTSSLPPPPRDLSNEVPLKDLDWAKLQRPARPYARVQLTVEPDRFVLQPLIDLSSTAHHATSPQESGQNSSNCDGKKDLGNDEEGTSDEKQQEHVQILFRTEREDDLLRQHKEEQHVQGTTTSTLDQDQDQVTDHIDQGHQEVDHGLKEEHMHHSATGAPSVEPLTTSDAPGPSSGRVSFVEPGTYTRSTGARDYVIYGCIGLLDLHTGPHLIVIASVKALGDIEDMAVFAIDKVAILPMNAHESTQVLDRLAQALDLSAGSANLQAQILDSESSSTLATSTTGTPVPETETLTANLEETVLAIPIKSPKIRFSFLGLKQEKVLQKSASSPNIPVKETLEDPASVGSPSSPLSPKRVSFEVPRLKIDGENTGEDGIQSPMAAASKAGQPGFFTKLKESMKARKSMDEMAGLQLVDPDLDAQTPAILEVNSETTSPQQQSEEQPTITIDTSSSPPASRPPASPRSPSALDAAEKFVLNSTKQLADWGEETVAGVLKSSTTFSLSKTAKATEDKSQEKEASENTQAKVLGLAPVTGGAGGEEAERNKSLDRRVIREMSSIFGTGFYFSTELNLLSSMQKRSDYAREHPAEEIPLWYQVDRRFWWNEHLSKEFLEIEANGYILPIMQGYVEIEQCEIEEQPFEFTLISRRSKERSGLRYQRRGIDETGNTANFVETEQLLRITRDDSDHQVSFVQTRGSIPLFWSQSPYRLKPIPIMERSEEENDEGFQKHVHSQIDQYGRQILISLVEQHGREVIAGSAYTHHVKKLAEPQVRYVEFDFHEQCRGMKYENIDRLIKSLEVPIHELGYCWLAPRNDGVDRGDDASFERLYDQKGVIRTNCMDCLDRTNVVQSAVGRHILNHQLLRLGIASFPDKGLSVYEDFENVFNHIWANNGDAISREYAGTSALKGDFTRTGKRNLQGMVNDATNSIARMYQNTFKDYFRQAAIDYLLGKADVDVFRNLQTTAFGTAVVPAPILPPVTEQPQQQIHSSASEPALPSLLLAQNGSVSAAGSKSVGLLPSLIPMEQGQQESSLPDEKSEEAWVRVREAAIETSAEIVISPGEERWKGWTFICCSNEISSALTSASSPYSSPQQPSKRKNTSASSSPLRKKSAWSKVIPLVDSLDSKKTDAEKEEHSPVFYDEKIVLLTEKALYICTYDYDMEKVLEFWRLALEKMTGIDKGAYFVTAQDASRLGQDPLENYGFAVIYRASAAGETLRVNSGSVRNRRMMGVHWTPLSEATDLEQVQEEEETGDDEGQTVSEGRPATHVNGSSSAVVSEAEDGRSAKSILKGEAKDFNTVRFKIVKHPETSIVPFVSSSSISNSTSLQQKANPSGYKRTAQDCVEWVVTEIVQARCELISVAEKGLGSGSNAKDGSETPPPPGNTSQHGASPSEEYTGLQSEVQVDLVIRDRVLQSLEMAAQLEGGSSSATVSNPIKKSKKSFSSFFTSSLALNKATQQQQQQQQQPQEQARSSLFPPQPASNNNKSWLKKFSFGNTSSTDDDFEDTDEEDTLERQQRRRFRKVVTKDSGPSLNPSETQGLVTAAAAAEAHLQQKQRQQPQEPSAQAPNGVDSSVSSLAPSFGQSFGGQRNSGGVFAKFKQAVKNL
ncbi:phosphatidylinositol 4-phosphatase [Entomortierella parvispora]|uniref:Phosphatidylinositol 4-phosphatase n=1 Tax=Entomortierella parvispora TaxID=205924 RepID=A0A9P3HAK4_9FUNG|nr:phosphatidylinositol 4-phosphatase [Entomortierella parvispora]